MKKLLLVMCLLSAGALYAAKAVRVTNFQADMAQHGYQVQACETAFPENCSPIHLFRGSISQRNDIPQTGETKKVAVKDRKQEGKTKRITSYDISFFVDGEKIVWIPGVMPDTQLECWNGGAFYIDAQTGEEKEVAWPALNNKRLNTEKRVKVGNNNHNNKK